jgi:integrase
MRTKPYSLWKRILPSGRTIYYVRFRLEDGSWGTAKSSGQSTKTAAEAWAIAYLSRGTVVTRENVTFGTFAKDFFAWDGEYVSRLRLRGKQIGKSHAANQQSYLDNYLVPAFEIQRLSNIDGDAITEFALDLKERGLAASTINHILLALKAILTTAYRKRYIQKVPEVDAVAGTRAERGILTPEEVVRFFALEWKDPRYLAINLIAATTGMRLGEILALQRRAVHEGYLEVSASWERGRGLKGTKTGRSRFVPVTTKTREGLKVVLETSPFTEPEDFVFVGRRRESPLDHKMAQRSFAAALEAIGIDQEARAGRGLTFHSWRHFFNSLLINGKVPILKVQTLTGHSTDKMTENYFHADDYGDVLEITGGIG